MHLCIFSRHLLGNFILFPLPLSATIIIEIWFTRWWSHFRLYPNFKAMGDCGWSYPANLQIVYSGVSRHLVNLNLFPEYHLFLQNESRILFTGLSLLSACTGISLLTLLGFYCLVSSQYLISLPLAWYWEYGSNIWVPNKHLKIITVVLFILCSGHIKVMPCIRQIYLIRPRLPMYIKSSLPKFAPENTVEIYSRVTPRAITYLIHGCGGKYTSIQNTWHLIYVAACAR